MDKEKFMQYAMSEIKRLHSDPALADYFNEIQNCLTILKIFQYLTIGIIILLAFRYKTFEDIECGKTNKIILAVSGLVLSGMMIYEYINYECMSSGRDSIPMGLQFMILLAIAYLYFRKK